MAGVYFCKLDPDTKRTIKVYLFRNVQNVEAIRSNINKGTWNCVVINARLILDPLQIAVAANRAALSEKYNTMVTRNVFTEILYNLSLSKNISQSLSKFGIEKDTDLLICFLGYEDDSKENIETCENIILQIKGELCSISDLHKIVNLKEVTSAYKISNVQHEAKLLDLIVSRMVTKNFVTY